MSSKSANKSLEKRKSNTGSSKERYFNGPKTAPKPKELPLTSEKGLFLSPKKLGERKNNQTEPEVDPKPEFDRDGEDEEMVDDEVLSELDDEELSALENELIAGFDSDTEDLSGDEVPPLAGNKRKLNSEKSTSSDSVKSLKKSRVELNGDNDPVIEEIDGKLTKKEKKMRANRSENRKRGVVYLSRIPHGFYEKEMHAYFTQFGKVTRLRLCRNRKGQSKHYAFIEFASEGDAKVVADTMDNYLLFNHLLKCKFVPEEEVHPNTFIGWTLNYSPRPWEYINRKAKNSSKSTEQRVKIGKKLLSKEEKKRAKLSALGIDYQFPGYAGDYYRRLKDVNVGKEKNIAITPEAQNAAQPSKSGIEDASVALKSKSNVKKSKRGSEDKKSAASVSKAISNEKMSSETEDPVSQVSIKKTELRKRTRESGGETSTKERVIPESKTSDAKPDNLKSLQKETKSKKRKNASVSN